MHISQFLAATEAAQSAGLFEALGIDVRLLLLQALAFLILVWFLGKYVYPILVKAIDDRQEAIENSAKAAEKAQKAAKETQSEVNALFKEARVQADEVVATAHKEAAVMLEEADAKAKKRAEHIVSEAKAQLDQDVTAARAALRADTAELVALATEKIIKEKVDAKRDGALIERALKEAS